MNDQLHEISTWLQQHSPVGNARVEHLNAIPEGTAAKHIGAKAAVGKSTSTNAAPGLRVLFDGLAGSGKTMAVETLAKESGRNVYRVDLSNWLSKHTAETEKNIAAIFDSAEQTGDVLFFDEADALFGKRTEIKDAHDRFANQEVAYLLQRIESHGGLVIVATKRPPDDDAPFIKRVQLRVAFPVKKPFPAPRT